MKCYEASAEVAVNPALPTIARIDGRAFHTFTKGMNRPFDAVLSSIMIDVTAHLVRVTSAKIGYTQSDEITLIWHADNSEQQIYFGGRIIKIATQLSATATLIFNNLLRERYPLYLDRLPTFDARVWQVPSKAEACNVLVWREQDAIKNSISMAASSVFTDKELHKKSGDEKKEMLTSRGVVWNSYPTHFKRGTYIQRVDVVKPFTAAEIDTLPEKHAARTNPALTFNRSEYHVLELPIFTKIVNREAVVFDRDKPHVHSSSTTIAEEHEMQRLEDIGQLNIVPY